MRRIALVGGRLVTPHEQYTNGALVIEDAKIVYAGPAERAPIKGARLIDTRDRLMCPGFLDVHVHGASGIIVASARTTQDVSAVRLGLLTGSVTSFLATIGSLGMTSHKTLADAVESCASCCGDVSPGAATMLGIHLEGPLLSPARAGVSKAWPQPEDTRPPLERLRELIDAGRGKVRLMTLAPELPGAMGAIEEIANAGIEVSLGHTDAAYEQAMEAFERGARQVTHLYNAMRPFNHREPGIIGAALTDERVATELICDGVHVHPAALRMALRAKLPEKALLITDGTGLEDVPDGTYRYPGDSTEIFIRSGRATLADGTIAGSTMRMNQQIRLLIEQVGVPVVDAIRMATYNPARQIGAVQKGELAAGKDADVVVLDDEYNVRLVSVMGDIWEVPR